MNDQPEKNETPHVDPDETLILPHKGTPRKSTRELPRLEDDPTVQDAARELGIDPTEDQPTDTTQDGEPMPVEPELHDVERRVRQLESHRAYTEERFTRHTQRLDGHDLRFDGLMTPTQLSDLIDEKWRARWQAIDQEYNRIEPLISDLSGKYGNAAFALEKVNALAGVIDEIKADGKRRGEQMEASTYALNQMVDTYASGFISLFGFDPRKPDMPRLKTSVMDDIEKLEGDTKTAKETAQNAKSEIADLRVILAGFTGQFQGEKGLFAEMREMRSYFDQKRQREQLYADVLRMAFGVVKTRVFQAAAGSVIGAGGLFVITKIAEFLSQLVSIGG